jgi:uncharacterized protein
MHMRLAPRRHHFRYRVFSLLIDIDRIDEALHPMRLLRHNRPGLLALHDRDHGERTGAPLRPWVEQELARAGLSRPERIELLAFPRLLGYVFNPLSVYYCYGTGDRLEALVYEVKNTWGDQVAYALPAGPARGGAHRQRQGKEMVVSPFIAMDQIYRFDAHVPDARLALRIRQAGGDGETLIATLTGEARPVTDRTLASAVLRHPLMTAKVIAAIHWEALRLWAKGVPLAQDGALTAHAEGAGR